MINKTVMTGALVAALVTGAAGGSALNAINANAATDTAVTTANTTVQQPTQKDQFDPTKGGHIGANGKKEELLTGDTAEKVKAAALAKVSGGTIERVETDAEGAFYEAHMTKSDGSHVTVKLDSSFNVTGVETGGPGGSRGQQN
jgi:uncharacterized membrane protein YkoI